MIDARRRRPSHGPLAALSIDLEGTAVGLRPPSQATYQALPHHAGSLGRLYPNINHMGVDGCVKARIFGEQPSPDVDGSVAVSGKIEGLNETRGHPWREHLPVPDPVVFCRDSSGILPFEHSAHAAAHDQAGLPVAAGGESVTLCPVVLVLVRVPSAAARSANVRRSPPPGFLPWSWHESRTQPACRLLRTGRQWRNGADSRETSLPEHRKRA